MMVEHEFITTIPADDALARAEAGLLQMGFLRVSVFDPLTESRPCVSCGYDLKGLDMKLPCPECGTRPHLARRVEYAKGKASARKAMFALENQPQRVFVEFDRGKLIVAASIEPYSKPEKLHSELMVAIASRVQRAVQGTPEQEILDPAWRDLVVRIGKRNFRKRLPQWIALGFIVIVLAAAVVVGVIASR